MREVVFFSTIFQIAQRKEEKYWYLLYGRQAISYVIKEHMEGIDVKKLIYNFKASE